MNTRIFVADDVSERGLETLRVAGFAVEKQTGLKGDELRNALREAEGLIVRSETKVTADLIDSAVSRFVTSSGTSNQTLWHDLEAIFKMALVNVRVTSAIPQFIRYGREKFNVVRTSCFQAPFEALSAGIN